ncbi:MAG TPA: MarR family transcriptional regulator [Burkholderiaceae bacterium]|nr:MarR family transcriptional regulator [Burkholderiaceae bacterium]
MTSSKPCPLYDGSRYVFAESIGHQLFTLMTMIRREVEVRMAEHDLTDAQWKPLMLLKNGRASTAIEIAREMDIDAGAVTRMLDRLEAKGMIERVRSDEDRRVVHLRLTRSGEATAGQVPHVLAAVNNDFLRGLTEAEFKQLRKLLTRMAANGTALQAERAEA